MKHLSFFVLCGAMTACLLPDTKPPGSPDLCPKVCANRIRLGCIEPMFIERCEIVCRRAYERKLIDPTCAAAARTQSQMVACGVRCYI